MESVLKIIESLGARVVIQELRFLISVSTGAGATSCGVAISDVTLGAATAADNCSTNLRGPKLRPITGRGDRAKPLFASGV